MTLTRINVDFRHDGQEYWAGEVRKLTPELRGYFKAAGWADDGIPNTTGETVTLEVHGGKHGLKASSVAE